MEWRYRPGFLSDVGLVRERNEDAFELYVPGPGSGGTGRGEAFFAVADGMGGHEAGDVASRMAIRSLRAEFHEPPASEETLETWLDGLFRRVHHRLLDAGRDGGAERGMGSTLTVAIVDDESLVIGHVGDSRLYRLRDGVLQRLTEDHSWVAEQIRQGLLTEEEAERHADRNVLTHCLGIGADPKAVVSREPILHRDRYLLSTDGLHGEVDPWTLERVLIEEGNPQDAARRLVGLAHDAGSPDNVTVVVFDTLRRDLVETAAHPVAPAVRPPAARWAIGGGALALVAGLAIGARALVRPAAVPDAPAPVPAGPAAPPAADSVGSPAPDDTTGSIDLHDPDGAEGSNPSPTPLPSAATQGTNEGEDRP